ncbi:MAG: hypothetical protein CMA49_03550 [Euryarchaeota archaeon]|nr:hypothetical protein [Euryarchaeota archaeon]
MRDTIPISATNLARVFVHPQGRLQADLRTEHRPIQGSAYHLRWIQSQRDEDAYQVHNRLTLKKIDGGEDQK